MSTKIAYCFDKNYANYAAVSTYSALINTNKQAKAYWIIPKEDQLSAEMAKNYFSAEFKSNIEIVPAESKLFSQWKECCHFTRGMYLRLLLPQLLAEEKVLYMDADTIVQNNVDELFQLELGEHFIGGILDPGGQHSRIPRVLNDPYINSGVMLMNLGAMRQDHSLEKSVSIYERYHNDTAWPDQCVINKYAEGKKTILHQKWNRLLFANSLTENQFNQYIHKNQTSIVHFVGSIKPWHKWCNPAATKFWLGVATKLKKNAFQIKEIDTLEHALIHAQTLDMNKKFEESSLIKGNIIGQLLKVVDSHQPAQSQTAP